jgi:hypothetical protein
MIGQILLNNNESATKIFHNLNMPVHRWPPCTSEKLSSIYAHREDYAYSVKKCAATMQPRKKSSSAATSAPPRMAPSRLQRQRHVGMKTVRIFSDRIRDRIRLEEF